MTKTKAVPAWRDALQATVEIRLLVRLLGLPLNARVLEVGCGSGNALEPLREQLHPVRLAGIDRDSALLELARERLHAGGAIAELACADVQQQPFAAESFDLVVDFGTLYRVP